MLVDLTSREEVNAAGYQSQSSRERTVETKPNEATSIEERTPPDTTESNTRFDVRTQRIHGPG
jgi:hypothetical protein